MAKEMHVDFKTFFFADHSTPVGKLIHDRRAQACWWYCLCAHGNLKQFDEGATYEGELDSPKMLGNIVYSVSLAYGIQDPSEMLKFIGMCKEEATRCGYDWDSRVEKPDRTIISRKVSTPTVN